MSDAYWRFAQSSGVLPPPSGLDPSRDYAGYLPHESLQTAGREIPGYLPHESLQSAGREIPGYLPHERLQSAGREIPGYLPRENSQPTAREFPAYLPRENSQFDDRIGQSMWRTRDHLGPPETLRDRISPYRAGGLTASEIGFGGISGIGLGGVPGGAGSGRMTTPTLEDPVLMAQRQGGVGMEPSRAGKPVSSEFYSARPDASLRLLEGAKPDASLRLLEGAKPDASSRLPEKLRAGASTNTIFVEGLPTDCTRREVAHIFRPFIGFKQIRVIHKEPRHAGGEPHVLCFVEFTDEKCAATALKALQGYKFDDVDHDSNPLKLQFAHFPGSQPAVAPVHNEVPRAAS